MKAVTKSRSRVVKKRLAGLLGSRRAIVIGLSLIILLAVAGCSPFLLSLKNRVSDSDKANDLAKIEVAVIASLNKNNHLPESLHLESLNLNLKGSLDDYTYTPDTHEDGSPTYSYTTCATFYTQTIKLPIRDGTEDFTTGGTGAQAYTQHRKGKQCFSNDYYKNGSHIELIYNPGEVVAPTVLFNDTKVASFVSDADKYYLAQRQAFDSPGTTSDLSKNCVKTKPQSTPYKDPFGNLYTCKVFYDNTVPVSGDSAHITSLINAFAATAKSEGFSVDDSTVSPNTAMGEVYSYRMLDGTSHNQFECIFNAIYLEKNPQTNIQYRYACTLLDLKNLPSGFTAVNELTGP